MEIQPGYTAYPKENVAKVSIYTYLKISLAFVCIILAGVFVCSFMKKVHPYTDDKNNIGTENRSPARIDDYCKGAICARNEEPSKSSEKDLDSAPFTLSPNIHISSVDKKNNAKLQLYQKVDPLNIGSIKQSADILSKGLDDYLQRRGSEYRNKCYVYSPLSLFIGLSMVYEGTSGELKSEFEQRLGVIKKSALRVNVMKGFMNMFTKNSNEIHKKGKISKEQLVNFNKSVAKKILKKGSLLKGGIDIPKHQRNRLLD